MELNDQRALVTGATSGIGRETARRLAAEGASVIVTGRDHERGRETVDLIEADGGQARFIAADMTDLAAVDRLATEAGRVDILVNNAARFPFDSPTEHDAGSFDAMVSVNVRAPFFLTLALAPKMAAAGSGSIINVSTMAASIGLPGAEVYGATKAALDSLTRGWAARFSGSGVRVNTIAPGPTHTETLLSNLGEGVEEQAAATLLRRSAAPTEIAEAILFLASPRSSYITGATLAADGGRTAI